MTARPVTPASPRLPIRSVLTRPASDGNRTCSGTAAAEGTRQLAEGKFGTPCQPRTRDVLAPCEHRPARRRSTTKVSVSPSRLALCGTVSASKITGCVDWSRVASKVTPPAEPIVRGHELSFSSGSTGPSWRASHAPHSFASLDELRTVHHISELTHPLAPVQPHGGKVGEPFDGAATLSRSSTPSLVSPRRASITHFELTPARFAEW